MQKTKIIPGIISIKINKKEEDDMKDFWHACHTTTPQALADVYNQAKEEIIKIIK